MSIATIPRVTYPTDSRVRLKMYVNGKLPKENLSAAIVALEARDFKKLLRISNPSRLSLKGAPGYFACRKVAKLQLVHLVDNV